jgi:hypothetical protein
MYPAAAALDPVRSRRRTTRATVLNQSPYRDSVAAAR